MSSVKLNLHTKPFIISKEPRKTWKGTESDLKNRYFPEYKSIDYKTSNISLEKGERIVLLSPGFFKNTRDKLGDDAYFQFLKKNWVESSEMIQEVTYQTKKKYNDLDFLPYDQTVLTIEVDKNVISKV